MSGFPSQSTAPTKSIIDSAQRLIDTLLPFAEPSTNLALSGRSPVFRDVGLSDLILGSLHSQISLAVRERLSDILEMRIATLQNIAIKQYRKSAKRLQSLKDIGLPDIEVEARLIDVYESRYERLLDELRAMLGKLLARDDSSKMDHRNTRGGFGDHTLRILEKAFSYTKSPLSAEIDHLSKLTSLEPHQVRTWFQNKRNRGNKPSANKKQLRTASSSHVQSSTQLPIIDGRRVASLPSRKYVPQARATRPLPRRNAPIQDVPLARTLSQESHESDGTTFSFSSIPSNGGFTGFSYPSIQPTQMQQPTYNLDPLITATYSQPQLPPSNQYIYDPSIPQQIDQYNPYPYGDTNGYPTLPTQMSELDFESYLNLNIDNLAPPTEDLGYDLEAQIQAALRPSTSQFETLAPTMSPSEGSPYSDFSNSWFNEFDFGMDGGNGDDMELLKVVLDGMSHGSSGGSPIVKTELYPGLGVGGRSESPETVASFALNSNNGSIQGGGSIRGEGEGEGGSGRQSPNPPGPSTSNSISANSDDLSFMFNFDLEPVLPEVQGGIGYGQNAEATGSGWIGGVLPYDLGDQVMGTA